MIFKTNRANIVQPAMLPQVRTGRNYFPVGSGRPQNFVPVGILPGREGSGVEDTGGTSFHCGTDKLIKTLPFKCAINWQYTTNNSDQAIYKTEVRKGHIFQHTPVYYVRNIDVCPIKPITREQVAKYAEGHPFDIKRNRQVIYADEARTTVSKVIFWHIPHETAVGAFESLIRHNETLEAYVTCSNRDIEQSNAQKARENAAIVTDNLETELMNARLEDPEAVMQEPPAELDIAAENARISQANIEIAEWNEAHPQQKKKPLKSLNTMQDCKAVDSLEWGDYERIDKGAVKTDQGVPIKLPKKWWPHTRIAVNSRLKSETPLDQCTGVEINYVPLQRESSITFDEGLAGFVTPELLSGIARKARGPVPQITVEDGRATVTSLSRDKVIKTFNTDGSEMTTRIDREAERGRIETMKLHVLKEHLEECLTNIFTLYDWDSINMRDCGTGVVEIDLGVFMPEVITTKRMPGGLEGGYDMRVEKAFLPPNWITEDMASTYLGKVTGFITRFLPLPVREKVQVSPNDFEGITDRPLELFAELQRKGYIDEDGYKMPAFYRLRSYLQMDIGPFNSCRRKVFREMVALELMNIATGFGPAKFTEGSRQHNRWGLGGMHVALELGKYFYNHPKRLFSSDAFAALQAFSWYQHGATDTVLAALPAAFWAGTFMGSGIIPLITGTIYPPVFMLYILSTLANYGSSMMKLGTSVTDLIDKESGLTILAPTYTGATLSAYRIGALKAGIDPGFVVTPTGGSGTREIEDHEVIVGNTWRLGLNALTMGFGGAFLAAVMLTSSHITSGLAIACYVLNSFFPAVNVALRMRGLNRNLASVEFDPASARHTYADDGTYDATLTIRDMYGNTNTDTIQVIKNGSSISLQQSSREFDGILTPEDPRKVNYVAKSKVTGMFGEEPGWVKFFKNPTKDTLEFEEEAEQMIAGDRCLSDDQRDFLFSSMNSVDLSSRNIDLTGLNDGITFTWDFGDGSPEVMISPVITSGLVNFAKDLRHWAREDWRSISARVRSWVTAREPQQGQGA